METQSEDSFKGKLFYKFKKKTKKTKNKFILKDKYIL